MQRYGQNNQGEAFLNIQPSIDGNYLIINDLSYIPGITNPIGAFWILKFDVEGSIIWERKYQDGGSYTWAEDFVNCLTAQ